MFFYLQWIDRRPTKIELLKDKPDDVNYETTFRIKKEKYVLCGNINPSFVTYYPPPKLQYSKNQYLLSHLQKCVRRMDDIKAVQTSKHLIDLDCNSFLRRLPIIMLEDVTLHESFPIIVWLMIAYSKDFKINFKNNIKIDIEKNGDFIINFDIFKGKGGLSESKRLNIPLLGKIPLDPLLATSSDEGHPYILNYQNSIVAKQLSKIASKII